MSYTRFCLSCKAELRSGGYIGPSLMRVCMSIAIRSSRPTVMNNNGHVSFITHRNHLFMSAVGLKEV